MVHYKKTNAAVKGHVAEFAGAVVVDDTVVFVCKCAKADHIGDVLVIDVVDDVVMVSRMGNGVGIVGFNKAGHAGVREESRDLDAGLF